MSAVPPPTLAIICIVTILSAVLVAVLIKNRSSDVAIVIDESKSNKKKSTISSSCRVSFSPVLVSHPQTVVRTEFRSGDPATERGNSQYVHDVCRSSRGRPVRARPALDRVRNDTGRKLGQGTRPEAGGAQVGGLREHHPRTDLGVRVGGQAERGPRNAADDQDADEPRRRAGQVCAGEPPVQCGRGHLGADRKRQSTLSGVAEPECAGGEEDLRGAVSLGFDTIVLVY
uniref:Uncharacterized protein n=1 Tax=Culex quinquefasciatus TaxID=7176 RepID=A0A904MFB5_CULQU